MSATVRCPYCQRQYMMKLSREEIVARAMRATCGRCGKSFDVASRIVDPGAGRLAPPPPPPPRSKSPPPIPAGSSSAEELDALTREIVAAAEQISASPRSVLPTEPPKAAIADVPAPAAEPAPLPPVAEVPAAVEDTAVTQTVAAVRPPLAVVSPPIAAAPRPAPDPLPEPPPPPLTWSDRADPGLTGFREEADPGLRALTQLLG